MTTPLAPTPLSEPDAALLASFRADAVVERRGDVVVLTFVFILVGFLVYNFAEIVSRLHL